ncbi:thermonuclease family protein [Dokdonella sp.]|uniref:thermonuclease family protein n=1 Tax=Dokdonella sp. TaxID=2291710 RepID=UPI0027B91F5A|nr:thermonuclease family protein [Dokdonella sp.]
MAWTPAFAGDLAGTVVGVVDGDTIDVLADGRSVRVRLAEIDAPERRQAFGTKARQALADLTFHRAVAVVDEGRDRYGRTIGTVTVDGRNINLALVAAGLAWAYTRYVVHPEYVTAQDAARAAKRGLWADPHPTPPWDFRRPAGAR